MVIFSPTLQARSGLDSVPHDVPSTRGFQTKISNTHPYRIPQRLKVVTQTFQERWLIKDLTIAFQGLSGIIKQRRILEHLGIVRAQHRQNKKSSM